jgi:D-glycero-alpha-D-manno-heptose-7-phosphate kinase
MSKVVFAKAPLRLGLAGGGTDLEPYRKEYGGVVLSGTIDQYAYCKVEPWDDWCFKSVDLDLEETHTFYESIDCSTSLKLLITPYKHLMDGCGQRTPIKITTYVEAPPGSGLGSSSALVVAVVSALCEYHNLPKDEYEIANLAVHVERNLCELPGGLQDQYSASFGGFNYIEFLESGRTIVNPLRLNYKIQNMLELNTVLYYVGTPRKDAHVIDATSENLRNNKSTLEATHKIKDACVEFKQSLLVGDVKKISDLMNEYWTHKLKTSSKVANAKMLDVYDFAMKNGATAAKISGAGGGGHMIFFTDFERRHKLLTALKEIPDGRVVPFKFVKHGVDVWRQ